MNTPTHDAIALRAYHIYLAEGSQHGRENEYWLRAEAELKATKPAKKAARKAPAKKATAKKAPAKKAARPKSSP